ncbi:MAG: CAP domain-containing protein [Bacteroidota bacterium]
MKVNLLKLMMLLVVIFTMNSCSSSDDSDATADNTSAVIVENYTYNDTELETMKLINDYRVSIGLNPLEKINHISYKSEEHDFYMIDNNVVSHDGFVERSENIMKVLGAKSVGENIAYNYNSPQAAVSAWLNSPGHKANIEGNYTHFGISIRINPTNGKRYYTNIFAKI